MSNDASISITPIPLSFQRDILNFSETSEPRRFFVHEFYQISYGDEDPAAGRNPEAVPCPLRCLRGGPSAYDGWAVRG